MYRMFQNTIQNTVTRKFFRKLKKVWKKYRIYRLKKCVIQLTSFCVWWAKKLTVKENYEKNENTALSDFQVTNRQVVSRKCLECLRRALSRSNFGEWYLSVLKMIEDNREEVSLREKEQRETPLSSRRDTSSGLLPISSLEDTRDSDDGRTKVILHWGGGERRWRRRRRRGRRRERERETESTCPVSLIS